MMCTHAVCDMRAVAMVQNTGRGLELVRLRTATVQVTHPGAQAFCRAHIANAVSVALEVWSQ
jgi:hypothetical protein